MSFLRRRYGIEFDNGIALKVFKAILSEWQKRGASGVYQELVLPQDKYKLDLNGKDMALFFFYAVLGQRGGIVSDQPMKVWAVFRERMPEAFNPVIAVTLPSEKILEGLKEAVYSTQENKKRKAFRGFHLEELSGYWIYNSRELLENWGGDPRNLFLNTDNFLTAFKRIEQKAGKTTFKGFGMKIFALLNIFLQEKKVIPFFASPIPVDFHTLRIFWATEIIKKTGWAKIHKSTRNHPAQLEGKLAINIYYSIYNTVAVWSQKFMEENDFSHLDMNPAIWLLSRTLCSKCFLNTSKKNATQYVDSEKLKKDHSMWPKKYKNPCKKCPIEKHCKWAIPSAPYWKWGLLVRTGERISYLY